MLLQTRLQSMIEAVGGTLTGFLIGLLCTIFVAPLFGMHPSFGGAVGFTLFMTAVSIARTYLIRRFNEARRHRNAPPDFIAIASELAEERRKQIEDRGFTLADDDRLDRGEISRGASAYAFLAGLPEQWRRSTLAPFGTECEAMRKVMFEVLWPKRLGIMKPSVPREELKKAGAMIIAEISRLDRKARHASRSASANRS